MTRSVASIILIDSMGDFGGISFIGLLYYMFLLINKNIYGHFQIELLYNSVIVPVALISFSKSYPTFYTLGIRASVNEICVGQHFRNTCIPTSFMDSIVGQNDNVNLEITVKNVRISCFKHSFQDVCGFKTGCETRRSHDNNLLRAVIKKMPLLTKRNSALPFVC